MHVLIQGGAVHQLGVDPALGNLFEVVDAAGADPALAVGWLYDGTGFAPPPPPPPPTVKALAAYAAAVRYVRETAGITVGGVKVATDEDSQNKIGNAYQLMQASGAASITFKGADGVFTALSADQFKALALAVGAHVQACYGAEAQVDAAIAAGTIATTDAIDAAFAAAGV